MLIYIVEDDSSIQKLIEYALLSKGYDCMTFENGEDFLKSMEKNLPDLILLDVMLPGINGIEILKKIKNNAKTDDIPVMMLTAKTAEYDIISALDYVADDYIKKPFSILELLSRINALIRRTNKKQEILEYDDILINISKRTVSIQDKEIILTNKEFELLKYMMNNIDIVLTRETILLKVWGYDYEGETRTVDMHIKSLREKLGYKRDIIVTIRGLGYKLTKGEL